MAMLPFPQTAEILCATWAAMIRLDCECPPPSCRPKSNMIGSTTIDLHARGRGIDKRALLEISVEHDWTFPSWMLMTVLAWRAIYCCVQAAKTDSIRPQSDLLFEHTAPNPICPSDSGGRAGFLTKPYKCEKVQILESELALTHFCKAVSQ